MLLVKNLLNQARVDLYKPSMELILMLSHLIEKRKPSL